MKALSEYINENLVNESGVDISKPKSKKYLFKPKNHEELKNVVYQLIRARGNNADLNDIDVSEITDMSYLFCNSHFDGDISRWDVSNVKNMKGMFNTSKFNAGRLVMTESSFISSLSQKDCYKDLDVEKYEIVATLGTVKGSLIVSALEKQVLSVELKKEPTKKVYRNGEEKEFTVTLEETP